ncbi:hypothetical protein [Mesobacterium pallidum]|uniref:hypothetical protein n=1 Tax=Mesobacterium pallidum TaxID=2872037 RepID=UPI001EE22E53|nr:hypothetical protein [Mesobacterium pallidum]
MPFLIAALGIAAAAWFYVIRARNAHHIATELMEAANDVRLAARRFGFTRRSSQHPVEALDDHRLAIAALGEAFVELDDLPTAEQRRALAASLGRATGLTLADAEEMLILGRWLVGQCGGAVQAIPRIGRKLYKLRGAEGFQPLIDVVQATAQAGTGQLSPSQKEALEDLRRAFRLG